MFVYLIPIAMLATAVFSFKLGWLCRTNKDAVWSLYEAAYRRLGLIARRTPEWERQQDINGLLYLGYAAFCCVMIYLVVRAI